MARKVIQEAESGARRGCGLKALKLEPWHLTLVLRIAVPLLSQNDPPPPPVDPNVNALLGGNIMKVCNVAAHKAAEYKWLAGRQHATHF